MLNMKKLIFYAVALLSVASLLNGCKKDDGNESKGPNVEGVYWFEEVSTDPSMTAGFYLVHIRSSKMKTAHPGP